MADWTQDPKAAAYMHHDTVQYFIERLESLSDGFIQTAQTTEQRELAEQFRELVAVVEPSILAKALRPAIDKAINKEPER
jgi:hypothetical protein